MNTILSLILHRKLNYRSYQQNYWKMYKNQLKSLNRKLVNTAEYMNLRRMTRIRETK